MSILEFSANYVSLKWPKLLETAREKNIHIRDPLIIKSVIQWSKVEYLFSFYFSFSSNILILYNVYYLSLRTFINSSLNPWILDEICDKTFSSHLTNSFVVLSNSFCKSAIFIKSQQLFAYFKLPLNKIELKIIFWKKV